MEESACYPWLRDRRIGDFEPFTQTKALTFAMVENGVNEETARRLVDQGVYSLETKIGVWIMWPGRS